MATLPTVDSTGALLLTREESTQLSIAAGNAFQPRSPISTREFFAGRWEQLTTVVDAVAQKGLHIVMFGERGVGKTSLANIVDPLLYVMEETMTGRHPEPRITVKVNLHQGDAFGNAWSRVFDEITWSEDQPGIGLSTRPHEVQVTLKEAFKIGNFPTIDIVRRTLRTLPRSVIIFDEFDRGSTALKRDFTDLIKALSDYAVDSTIILVGVSETVDQLIRDHASIVRAIVQVQLPRMNERELKEILDKASKALKVQFSPNAAALIVRMSQGLPHYTHLIGLHATREAALRLSRLIQVQDVHRSFDKAVKQAVQSIQEKYLLAIHSAHREALYDNVLLACAMASSSAKDALGYFHPADIVQPISAILGRENVTIATFQKHINEFCEAERGRVLERHGSPRAYKYRFHDPLLPPYIFMTALANGDVNVDQLRELTASTD
jgi:hypothetical protein